MRAEATQSVTICEVGPRDGLQNESRVLTVDERVALIDRLSACGLTSIEAVSFVDPRRVPQMGQAEEVMARINRRPGVSYAGLVLNERGALRAFEAKVDGIRFVVVATESFNRRNQGVAISETVHQFGQVTRLAKDLRVRVTGVIGAAFGCPFEGPVPPGRVWDLASRLVDAGADEVILADTIGSGVPSQVNELVEGLRARFRGELVLGCHFHNTRNLGLANAYSALAAGVTVLDASIGGAGGCPFAPAATGNIPTEDVAYMMRGLGYPMSVDLAALIDTAGWLQGILGKTLPGMVMKAGLYPESVRSSEHL
jgi:isopropylmalate/homocitrate/citramalate synthase